MNKYIKMEALGFDDLMLIPKHSTVSSRANVDLKVELSKGFKTSIPIIASNMKTVTGIDMLKFFYSKKAIIFMHRFLPFQDQMMLFSNLFDEHGDDVFNYVGASVGIKDGDYDKVDRLIDNGIKLILIDVAHGHSEKCIKMTQYISTKYPQCFLISGNSATYEGALAILEAGADVVKCNVGSGSICSTRIQTGNGLPQMTTLFETRRAKEDYEHKYNRKVFILSDGGAKSSGDLVKALTMADLVMTGNLFSGCDETPGEMIKIDGKAFKRYDGSSTHRGNHTEGVQSLVHTKGSVSNVLQSLLEGIASGCSYQGAHNLQQLKDEPQFAKITAAGYRESQPHDVIVIK